MTRWGTILHHVSDTHTKQQYCVLIYIKYNSSGHQKPRADYNFENLWAAVLLTPQGIFCPPLLSRWREGAQATRLISDQTHWLQDYSACGSISGANMMHSSPDICGVRIKQKRRCKNSTEWIHTSHKEGGGWEKKCELPFNLHEYQ